MHIRIRRLPKKNLLKTKVHEEVSCGWRSVGPHSTVVLCEKANIFFMEGLQKLRIYTVISINDTISVNL